MANEKQPTLKEQVLSHYDRMIAWAETQPSTSFCSSIDMTAAIQENWFGKSCPLCNAVRLTYTTKCSLCPVFNKTTKEDCVDSPWEEMVSADTWEKWLVAAKKERAFLESLEYPDA